jgi:UDP-glucose 4-epimerase
MRILITGAAGYIGTNLSHYLRERKHEITETDKIYNSSAENLTIKDCELVDAIVHLAAMPSISECENNKIMAVNDNVVAAENIFRLGYELNVPVVFASSQAAKNPESTYGLLKNTCEQLGIRMNVNILRIANVYGGQEFLQRKTSVVANFVNAKLKQQPININGDGTQTRDFIHVDEVCRAIEFCLRRYKTFVDIGTGVHTSINELAAMLQCKNIRYIASNGVGVKSNAADIYPAIDAMGFIADDKLLKYLTHFIS